LIAITDVISIIINNAMVAINVVIVTVG